MLENKFEIPDTITFTIDELLFVNIPSKARTEVIEASVTIERVITSMLAMFLDIDIEDSKSFGKAGLSFNSKLHLLADIKMIDKEEKGKLIKFSEIRNIFAHDSSTHMFYQCFDQLGLRAFLVKKYSEQNNENDSREQADRMLFTLLFEDVKKSVKDFSTKRC